MPERKPNVAMLAPRGIYSEKMQEKRRLAKAAAAPADTGTNSAEVEVEVEEKPSPSQLKLNLGGTSANSEEKSDPEETSDAEGS